MLQLNVTGMNCRHCVEAVTRALKSRPGVDTVNVNLKTGQALVDGKDLNVESLCEAVQKLGYGCAVSAEPPS